MNDTEQTKIAARVAALLAKAESTEFENERDALLEKATALQFKYVIDQAMIDAAKGSREPRSEKITAARFCEERNTPLIKAKRELIATLARHHRCQAIILPGRKAVIVYGFESDVALVTMLFNSLALQMQNAMSRGEVGQAGGLATWRVSFSHAYVRRVHARFSEISRRQAEQAQQTTGAELALRSREVAVQDEVRAAVGPLRKSSYPTEQRANAAGRAAGYAAGAQADLGQRQVGDQRPAVNA